MKLRQILIGTERTSSWQGLNSGSLMALTVTWWDKMPLIYSLDLNWHESRCQDQVGCWGTRLLITHFLPYKHTTNLVSCKGDSLRQDRPKWQACPWDHCFHRGGTFSWIPQRQPSLFIIQSPTNMKHIYVNCKIRAKTGQARLAWFEYGGTDIWLMQV